MHAPHGLNVLVVDDHPDCAESLADLFGLYGHRVEVAHTAREARAAAERAFPEVAVLDLRLPDLDGWQVARWLLEQAELRDRPRPFLMAVSGCGLDEDVRRSTQAGIDMHLVKPVDPTLLVQVLAARRPPACECEQYDRVLVGV
jgi:two-component system, OmpR family, response regulator